LFTFYNTTMLNSCFGCCPLQHGVSGIAIVNIMLNIIEIIKHSTHRFEQYGKLTLKPVYRPNSTFATMYDNMTIDVESPDEPESWLDYEEIPIMSGIFMDYILMTTIGWIVLELISNIGLKQSTFKHAPHKVYVWLVIYYANLLFMVLHMVHYAMLVIRYPNMIDEFLSKFHKYRFGHYITKLIYIVIVGLEIIIVHSHYIKEKNAMLNDYIQLKWKYVSKGKVVSKGVDYPSTSTFKEEMSGQTQDGSRIPPYITKIVQN